MRKILLVLLAGLLPALSSGEEQRFAFALPEMQGRISLGVFDSAEGLVRTLFVGAAETDFSVGLNGLIATWDGRDDEGRPLPAGKYRVRGYLVGNALKAEGVAYHFNDWIYDEKSPRVTRIEDFRRLPGGFVILADVLGGEQSVAFRFDQLRGILWTNPLNAAPASDPLLPGSGARLPLVELAGAPSLPLPVGDRMLALTDQYAAVLLSGVIHLLRTDDGTTVTTQPEGSVHAACMDASDDVLVLGASEGIAKMGLPALAPLSELKTPVSFNALAVDGERILGASSRSSEVWESKDAQWRKLPLAAAVSSLSLGLKGTFWVTATDAENGKPFTGQFDTEGELLRAYRDEFSPAKVRASTEMEEIAVLEASGSAQRLRVLSLVQDDSDASGDWAIAFEKTIQDCRRFGIVDGKLAADAGAAPQTDQVNITLATGGLTPSAPTLAVRVTFDHTGLWLQTRSGLRLAFLANQPNVRRVALLLGPEKKFLTVFAGDDTVVAEYGVRGLGNIVEIDAGEVELP